MDGLQGLRKNISLKALFVLLAVLAFLFLGAVFSQPARADLIGADSTVIDQVEEVAEATGATVADSGAPLEEVLEEVPPPVVEEVIETEVSPPAAEEATEGEEATEVADAPPVLDDVAAVVEDVPPIVDESIELVENVVPVEEIVEDVLPVAEIVDDVPILEELPPILDEVVSFAPPLVVEVVQVLPILVFDVVGIPGPIDVPTAPAIPPTLNLSPPASLATEIAEVPTSHSDVLFSRQLVAELAQLQLAGVMDASTAGPSSSSPVPDPETHSLAAYVPIAGPLPVVEAGAGGSGLGSSSHAGSGFFGSLGAFGYFAALAALLALCLVGWIRDRSRSGRSIFPSHGGRPG